MYNTSNPAEIYPSTTWELIASDKYLKTTTGTPLSSGGSNSFTIAKANLPAEKLKIDSFSVTIGAHEHKLYVNSTYDDSNNSLTAGFDIGQRYDGPHQMQDPNKAMSGGSGNTGTASPNTQNMGSGTPISISPIYITVRAWKRLT